jgi:hypothetical protein
MTIGAQVSGRSSTASSSAGSHTGSWRPNTRDHLDYANPMTTREKPMAATILTALAALGGVDALLIAVNLNFLAKVVPSLTVGSALGLLNGSIPLYFMSVLGVASLASAYLFFRGNSRAWRVGLVFSVLDVLSILWSNYVGFAFGLASLYFLTRFETKVWFHRV